MSETDDILEIARRCVADTRHETESLRTLADQLQDSVKSLAARFEPLPLRYASEALQNDRAFVLSALQANGDARNYTNAAFHNDTEIATAAIEQYERSTQRSKVHP